MMKIFNYYTDDSYNDFIRSNIINIVKGEILMETYLEEFKQLMISKYSFTPLYISIRELLDNNILRICIYTLDYNDSIGDVNAPDIVDMFFDILHKYNIEPPKFKGKVISDKKYYCVGVQDLRCEYINRCKGDCNRNYRENKMLDSSIFWVMKGDFDSSNTYFTYTEKQKKQLMDNPELFKKYCMDYFNYLKANYDPCNMIQFEDIKFNLLSKEYFDRVYQGDWRYYYYR